LHALVASSKLPVKRVNLRQGGFVLHALVASSKLLVVKRVNLRQGGFVLHALVALLSVTLRLSALRIRQHTLRIRYAYATHTLRIRCCL
jgi:hypothetical protein